MSKEDEILEGFHFADDYDPLIYQLMLLIILLLPTGLFQGSPFCKSCSFVLAYYFLWIVFVAKPKKSYCLYFQHSGFWYTQIIDC